MPVPKECDLVMKGGITSGVIYPRAICKLAETYRFRSIGGASAGAIAAAAAAAAEYCRQTKHGDAAQAAGFHRLHALPDEISAPTGDMTKLLSLFQPAPKTRRVFRLVLAVIAKRGKWWRIPAGVIGLAPWTWGFGWMVALLCFARGWPARGLLALVATTLGGLGLGALRAYRAVAGNRGGIADGLALSTWLADLIDEVAGRSTTSDPPLTFGDLAAHQIELAMITTSLSHGRPFRLPIDVGLFFAKRADLDALFPARVVEALVAAGAADLATDDPDPHRHRHRARMRTIRDRNPPHFVPLPDAANWPVVFATRMSLSFPMLLSAVPLYTLDFAQPSDELQLCWFSDGGICSNLPIHYFDSLLPVRPTFALDLRADEAQAVTLPTNNAHEANDRWVQVGQGDELAPTALLGAIASTMQNWSDTMQATAPGYRDRIAHIGHTKSEGGMNLDMEKAQITALAERGEAAGALLVAKFSEEGGGWPNHVWVRYRSALAMMQELVAPTIETYAVHPTRRAELDQLIDEPPSYAYAAPHAAAQQAAAHDLIERFAQLDGTPSMTAELRGQAPRPPAELRARPKGS